MWLLVLAARPLTIALTLLLCLESSSAHASEHRWYCDSEAFNRSEALNRITWAWSCGIKFCFRPHIENWSEADALATCGYPVFNRITPVFPLYDEETGHPLCHQDTGQPTESGPHSDGDLSSWLSDLVLMATCSPADEWHRIAH